MHTCLRLRLYPRYLMRGENNLMLFDEPGNRLSLEPICCLELEDTCVRLPLTRVSIYDTLNFEQTNTTTYQKKHNHRKVFTYDNACESRRFD